VLRWDIGASYQWQQQAGTPTSGIAEQSSKLVTVLTDLNWQVGERLGLRFIYAHSRQTGTSSYSDNQIGVIASWAFVGAQQRMLQPPPGLSPISPASTLVPRY
jgi:hypothetical protein